MLPSRCHTRLVSENFPFVTSDEIDDESDLADKSKREEEIKADKPPHHD